MIKIIIKILPSTNKIEPTIELELGSSLNLRKFLKSERVFIIIIPPSECASKYFNLWICFNARNV